jgi:hypothetical protein
MGFIQNSSERVGIGNRVNCHLRPEGSKMGGHRARLSDHGAHLRPPLSK